MSIKLLLLGIVSVSYGFCMDSFMQYTGPSELLKTASASCSSFQEESCVQEELFVQEEPLLFSQDADYTFQRSNQVFALKRLRPESDTCWDYSGTCWDYLWKLAKMLSNPTVMCNYLAGDSYEEREKFVFALYFCLIKRLYSVDDNMLATMTANEKIDYNFASQYTEEQLLDGEIEIPESAQYTAREIFTACVLCFLADSPNTTIKESFDFWKRYIDTPENKQIDFVSAQIKKKNYLLPQKVAAHLNLDLRADGLPRFILLVNGEIIGLIRLGSYPKLMVKSDFQDNPKVQETLENNLVTDGGCSIAAMMIKEEYQNKGYAQLFLPHIAKILYWYATSPDAPQYPEGPLRQVYVTCRKEHGVTLHLIEKLALVFGDRFEFVYLGEFMSGKHIKVGYLIKIKPLDTTKDTAE